jgi:hypothetical protein
MDYPVQPEIVSVPLSRIVPDRYQARLAIPPELKFAYFSGQKDCYEIARLLLVAGESDAGGLHTLVNDLILLGQSIITERQIDPCTGTWVDTDSGQMFVLETGERRFWALALQAAILRLEEEPELKVVPQPGNSRQRQVVENFMRRDLCAVELGKAVATMILESLDIYPEENEDELAYYRRALQINRLPSGTWPEIERLTGKSRPVLYRHLHILTLDDDLLYLATLHRLPEGALRDIVTVDSPEKRRRMLLGAVDDVLGRTGAVQTGGGEMQRQRPGRAARTEADQPRKLAGRALSLLDSLLKQGQLDGNYDRVAAEISANIEDAEALDTLAGVFESLASSLRKMQGRRKR